MKPSRKQKVLFLVFFCASFFVGLPLSFSQTTSPNRYGGHLILATTSDPKSFNPILAKETSTTVITGLLFEGLTRTNGITTQVEPNLAKSWKVSEDGRQWTFYLRQDVVWSDRYPFTADDVLFTFNDIIYNDKIPSSARDIFSINGKRFLVEKIDDFTVRFTLPMKFAPFLRAMGQAILPKHCLLKAVKDGNFNFTWGIDTPPKDIVGTGPYILERYQPGERIVFHRNPHYWKKDSSGYRLPYIEKIIYLIVQNQDTVLLKFLEGDLDMCSLRGMDYPLLKPLEKEKDFTIYNTGPNFGSNFITFNQNPGINPKTKKPYVDPIKLKWFSDIHFRRAVAHAIDKKGIIEILMNGLGYEQNSAMSPSSGYFYNPNVRKYSYDLKKAKQILEKAGYRDYDGDGIIEKPKGHPVEFSLVTNSGSTERIQIAAIIRRDLEQLGMKVNFLALEFNNIVNKLVSNYDWEAVIIGLTGGIEPHFGRNVWHSSGQLHIWYPRQKSPHTSWEKRIDTIFDTAVQELDPKKRKKLYDEWQEIVAEKLPLIYTVLGANIFAVRNKFGNLKPSGYGGVFHNLEEIYIKPQYRKSSLNQ